MIVISWTGTTAAIKRLAPVTIAVGRGIMSLALLRFCHIYWPNCAERSGSSPVLSGRFLSKLGFAAGAQAAGSARETEYARRPCDRM